ncbi:Protein of unknown function (DUF3494) [Seminavis robusta]|uniref:Uncharacterized protein n=1 Tax=Seminavis robusta TaxID=568900 RepID=A0A9N8EL64_9STRA|nr:Protein of unknown function (DUF3494) [Seminavis robusta]|eukprot:Sro1146_g246330.1 Protein of unknown function (DUF3494) (1465) ;mRNA; f:24899-29469
MANNNMLSMMKLPFLLLLSAAVALGGSNDGDTAASDGGVTRCSQASEAFHSSLILVHVFSLQDDRVVDDWRPSETEQQMLGDLFIETYNREQNGDGFCDPHYRRLSSVSVDAMRYSNDEMARFRTMQDGNGTTTVTVPLRYELEGYCEGCRDELFGSSSEGPSLQGEPPRGLRVRKSIMAASTTSTSSQYTSTPRLRADAPSAAMPNDCECQSTPETLRRAPTQDEFLQSLNQAILEQQQQDNLVTIQSATKEQSQSLLLPARRAQAATIDIQEYACDAPQNSFDATVFLHVPASTVLDTTSMTTLGDNFRLAYNNLTFTLCDVSHFRKILRVTVEDDQSTVLDSATDISRSSNTRILTLHVQTDCLDCNATTPLFHVLPRPATLAPGFAPIRPFGGGVANVNTRTESACLCPKNDTNVFRAPTSDEFLAYFDGNSMATTVLEVEEEQRLECSASSAGVVNTNFTSYAHVAMDVAWEKSIINETEKLLLEEIFRDTYNELAYSQCDEHHRTVVNVTLVLDQPSSNEATATLEQEMDTDIVHRSVVFSVAAQCRRDCPLELYLFDDEHTDATQLSTNTGRVGGRNLQQNVCTCAPGVQPGQSLLEQDFLVAFNRRVAALKLATVESALDLVEAEQVDCGNSTNDTTPELRVFTSSVLADVSLDLTNLTDAERLILEQTFLQTYNDLTFLGCDDKFRSIVSVSLQSDPAANKDSFRDRGNRLKVPGFRRLLSSSDNNSTAINDDNNSTSTGPDSQNATDLAPVAAVFSVTGTCRNCPVSETGTFNLFDDAFGEGSFSRRRQLASSSSVVGLSGRALQEQVRPGVCFCPVGVPPGEMQGPTAGIFQSLLNQQVADLQEEESLPPPVSGYSSKNSTLTNIQELTVENVIEVHPVDCGGNVTNFQSAVYTGLRVNEGSLDGIEKGDIEQGFRALYNDLSFTGCDGFFRTVTKVELVVGEIVGYQGDLRRLQVDGNGTLPSNTTNATAVTEPTVFLVTGQCRNCPVTRSGSFQLFDDGFRRALSESLEVSPDGGIVSRSLFDLPEDSCYCPAGAEPGRGPSSDEFVPDFNDVVVQSVKGGQEDIVFARADQKVAEVDIACAFADLKVVEATYTVTLPRSVLALPPDELRSFIDRAYPQAYNEFRNEECSPVLLQADLPTMFRRLQVQPRFEPIRRTLRVVSLQPSDRGTDALYDASDPQQEIRVAQRVEEIFILSQARGDNFEIVSEAPTTTSIMPSTSVPTLPPIPTPFPTPDPTPSPTKNPTPDPTLPPTPPPTNPPTAPPTNPPTNPPTAPPTNPPTEPPTPPPTVTPGSPSSSPTTGSPTGSPSTSPSTSPSEAPTDPPTPHPTWERATLVRFVLIDCSTGAAVSGYETLSDGAVLDRSTLPAEITIEAITDPPEIGEVQFYMDGATTPTITETKFPYSLSSNRGDGSFRPSTLLEPSPNTRTLRADPIWYWGLVGTSLEISFTIV